MFSPTSAAKSTLQYNVSSCPLFSIYAVFIQILKMTDRILLESFWTVKQLGKRTELGRQRVRSEFAGARV